MFKSPPRSCVVTGFAAVNLGLSLRDEALVPVQAPVPQARSPTRPIQCILRCGGRSPEQTQCWLCPGSIRDFSKTGRSFPVSRLFTSFVDDGMRITHGNCGHVIFFPSTVMGSVDHRRFRNHRSFAVRNRGTHVDFYHGGLAVADKIYIFDTGFCGDV